MIFKIRNWAATCHTALIKHLLFS